MTGIQGVTGIIGSLGKTGLQGVTGIKRSQGETGLQGVTSSSTGYWCYTNCIDEILNEKIENVPLLINKFKDHEVYMKIINYRLYNLK